MSKLDRFRRFMLRHPLAFCAWRLLLTLLGKVVLFWRRPQLGNREIDWAYRTLRYRHFAILGVGSRRFATGLFLPRGKYDVEHTAVYIGHGLVVEAVTPKVRVLTLRDFLKQYDSLVIGTNRSVDQQCRASSCALDFVGHPYDVIFRDGHRMLYCHELGAGCLQAMGVYPDKTNEYWSFDDLAAACDSVETINETQWNK